MSAQQIPNLLSLRGGPRLRGGRGRGRGRPDGPGHGHGVASASQQRQDLDIQATDTDAAVSRLSAVSVGYLDDPYASYFVSGSGTRRLPIINRGTYTRTTALDILIDAFLAQEDPNGKELARKQIISLGAGTDTRYFRLRAQKRHTNVVYHEFDFPSVSATKWRIVSSNERLGKSNDGEAFFPISSPTSPSIPDQEREWGFTKSSDGITETTYCFHPTDLRNLPSRTSTAQFQGLESHLPTLIISECCLCYLEVENSRDVVKWFTDRIKSLGIILYEPIGVDDSFGQMMVANLAARNIVMPSLKSYRTLDDQKNRMAELGFSGEDKVSGQEAESIETIWEDWVPTPEKERVHVLEGLDEVEEWQMLARHYAVVWAWRGEAGWESWKRLRDRKP